MTCKDKAHYGSSPPCMTHSCVGHYSFMRWTWLEHVQDMTHSQVGHDSIMWETLFVALLFRACVMAHSYVGHDTILNHVRDMTHLFVGHDSFMCGTWPIHVWDMTHSCVWHESFMCGTSFVALLIRACVMAHSYVGHDSIMGGTWRIHVWDMTLSCVGDIMGSSTFVHVSWLIHTCDVNPYRSFISCASFIHITYMNWLNLSLIWIDWFWLRGWLNNKGALCRVIWIHSYHAYAWVNSSFIRVIWMIAGLTK